MGDLSAGRHARNMEVASNMEVARGLGQWSRARRVSAPVVVCWRRMRLQVEYHLFLTELSERPGRHFAISAQRVPSLACISRMV